VEATRERPAALMDPRLSRGLWRVRAEPASQELLVGLRPSGSQADFAVIPAGRPIPVERESSFDLALSATPGSRVSIREVILTRAP
jgi:hypothetical protein